MKIVQKINGLGAYLLELCMPYAETIGMQVIDRIVEIILKWAHCL